MAQPHFLSPGLDPGNLVQASAPVLRKRESGLVVASPLEIARDSAARKRGLLGRDGLAPGAALAIAPCSAVHTFGMRFAIDAIFTDRDGRVLKIAAAVQPGRIAAALGAFATIEMAAGEAGRHGVEVGDRLEVTPGPA